MTTDAQRRDEAEFLRTTLISLLGRMVTVEQMREALELKSSTYYDQASSNRLLSLDNMKTLARNMRINPIYLMVELDILREKDAEEFCSSWQGVRRPNPLVGGGKRKRLPRMRDIKPRDDAPPL